MSRPIRYFYQVDNTYHYLDEETNTFGSVLANQKDNKYNYFHLMKGDDESNDGLIAYQAKFKEQCAELARHGIVYKKYYSHHSAVEMTFKRYTSDCYELLNNDFDDCSFDEYQFNERCYNGGLIYLDEQYKNTTLKCHGYDYSSFYPNILNGSDLKVSVKEGTKIKLDSLNYDNLQYGIYKVKITCDDKEFLKVFSFSPKGYYTHFSILFAYKHREQFNVSFELDTNAEHNALVYDERYLIDSYKIFGKWFNNLNNIKKACKNDLLKRLMSSLWGSLIKKKIEYLTEEQYYSSGNAGEYSLVEEKNYFINGEQVTRYDCIKTAKPYAYHYGRMKAFLLSVARNTIGNLIIKGNMLNNVIRINTDGIVLRKKYKFDLAYSPIEEAKTTGMIKWYNVNKYVHICEKCLEEYEFNKSHPCVS